MRYITKAILCIALMAKMAFADPLIVRKQTDSVLHEVHYGIQDEVCRIEWVMEDPGHPSEFPGLGIKERLETTLGPEAQKPYRRALLQAIKADTNGFKDVCSFSWGRLRSGKGYEAYADRFLALVKASHHWDRKRAKVVRYPKGVGTLIEDLLTQQNIFSEIQETFQAEGLELQVTDVENIIVGSVGEDGTIIYKKSTLDKFPLDFMFSVSVRRMKKP